ncbi:peptidylprolyl isomerase [Myxococcus sp. RHSTA-1-4]|uniref:peptidylprolyl isomerase n=1 Tax=Myxococcus sp. RHSTA-1-4 TaxID=2874601 RepID=UPI001CBBAB1F|nr:peptidylprolyl isomerase [Myxococcus sp. RHSTA-1-4]MBZ4421219.1 peptidylprolyl isomerase [Myxococcus sp. RHSTA-1-4]
MFRQRVSARWVSVLALAGLALAACGDANVVAEVGKREVTKPDVSAFIASRSSRERPSPPEALDFLVERSLLAEEARRSGLAEDPLLQARLRTAERELLAQALLDKRMAEATTDAELRKRYESSRDALAQRQVHVRQIMVRVAPGVDEEARARAQSRMNGIFARLVGGEPFEKVAREASEETVSAARGGDLGPVLEGQVDPLFFAEAARLKQGERSKPFATAYGLHLLEAVEGMRTVVPAFEEARGKLEADARREAQERLVEQLRQQISIKTYPERLEAPAGSSGPGGTDGGQRP